MGEQPDVPPASRTRRRGLWQNRDFLKLWSGETVAEVGAQVTQLALPLLVLTTLHGNAAQVGVVAAMQYLPALCVTPFAGLVIDLFDRRVILLCANLVRVVALAFIPVLYLGGGLGISAVCGIAFAIGAGTAVFDVAYLAYLPAVVEQDDLVAANSKLQGSYSVAQIAGPGVGGLLIKGLGAWLAIVANIASYLFSFLAIAAVRHRDPGTSRTGTDRPRLSDVVTSFGLLWRDRMLRFLAVQSAWFNLCEQAVLTLFLVYAVKDLHFGAGTIGLVLSLGSVGSLVGATVAQRLGRRLGFPHVLVLSKGTAACAPLLLLLTGHGSASSFVVAVASFTVYGFGLTISNVHGVAFRQAVIPTEILGRATASYRMVTYGTLPIGAFLGGLLGKHVGLWLALAVFGAVSTVGWVRFVYLCRRLPRQPASTGAPRNGAEPGPARDETSSHDAAPAHLPAESLV